MDARIPLLIGIFLVADAFCEERSRGRIWDGSTEWPALTREQWHDLILGFYAYGAPFDPKQIVLGDPVAETEIEEFEDRIELQLPRELRHFYQSQNGFGMIQPDGKVDWIFVPIQDIPRLTAKTNDWMRSVYPELNGRVLAFIDWDDEETAGILYSETGSPTEKIFGFVPGIIKGSKQPYYILELTIANVLTEPLVPPRLRSTTKGEHDGGLKGLQP